MNSGMMLSVISVARQTDADVECDVAEGGPGSSRNVSEKLHPDQHRINTADRKPQHPSDH